MRQGGSPSSPPLQLCEWACSRVQCVQWQYLDILVRIFPGGVHLGWLSGLVREVRGGCGGLVATMLLVMLFIFGLC